MKIRVAGSAGFCYGVRRAVELAEKAAARGPVYLLGHITHNDHVIRRPPSPRRRRFLWGRRC